jgi:hypothetical protein
MDWSSTVSNMLQHFNRHTFPFPHYHHHQAIHANKF